MQLYFAEIGVQVLIVFIGGAAFQVTRIGGREWGISLALGIVSMPLGLLIRLMPNAPFEKLFIKLHLLHNPEVLPTTLPNGEWNFAINRVRDNLGMFANLRGGRVRSSSFVIKSRSARLQDSPERPTLYVYFAVCVVPLTLTDTILFRPSLMTMVPTLVASSIGAGWAPSPGSLSDPTHSDPSRVSLGFTYSRTCFDSVDSPPPRCGREKYRFILIRNRTILHIDNGVRLNIHND